MEALKALLPQQHWYTGGKLRCLAHCGALSTEEGNLMLLPLGQGGRNARKLLAGRGPVKLPQKGILAGSEAAPPLEGAA